jgi:hypothetical protein
MTAPLTPAGVKAKMDTAHSRREYQLIFVALLGKAAGVPPDDLIVVGGSAIEIHTAGAYSSGDIDLVSSRSARLREVLAGWGFSRGGRVFENGAWGLWVDLVGYPYTGSLERTSIVATEVGDVRLAAIEDLLVKRLVSAKFWNLPGDQEHAHVLAKRFFGTIDWPYVERFAAQQGVGELAAKVKARAAR